jgi:hypothetical protein
MGTRPVLAPLLLVRLAMLACLACALSGAFGPLAVSAQLPPGAGVPNPANPSIYNYPCAPMFLSPVSMTPITTSNFLGSCATFYTPTPTPVPRPSMGGSYCSVGDEQIYVPAGAAPTDYGCSVGVSTPVTMAPATPVATAPPEADGHTYYASKASNATTIYCDTDPDWKTLSPANLLNFSSLEAAMAALPAYHLHQPC